MAVSKVAYNGSTLIDLTQDTAVESDVASGKYFHKADGTRVQGTASHSVNLQNKTVNLGSAAPAQTSADEGYDGLGTVSFNTSNIDGTKIRTGSSVCGVAGSYDGIIPAGNKDIDTTSQVGVSAYATARISATERAKIIAGNIKSGVTILGVTGNYSGTTPTFARACTVTITLDNSLDDESSYDLLVGYRGYDPLDTSKVIWKTETYHFDDETPTVAHTIYLTPPDTDGIYKDGIYVPVGDGGTTSSISSCINCASRFMTDNGETGTENVYVTIHTTTASFNVSVSNM